MNQLAAIDAAGMARGPGAGAWMGGGQAAALPSRRQRRAGQESWRGKAIVASAAGCRRPGLVSDLSENAALQAAYIRDEAALPQGRAGWGRAASRTASVGC